MTIDIVLTQPCRMANSLIAHRLHFLRIGYTPSTYNVKLEGFSHTTALSMLTSEGAAASGG